ncbi:YjbF family lipoprotein [Pseudoroseicyclus tamaricis]|uniref:YjbF family lipoprotein n=2 Tax=Pseudoroseicyclus tamaricis TaxID=2705421 RepID=A0A6B2JLV6_9RHOB|nr:YjbF family lipoprotein [Pseudoroseicyclus tamaricis]NDV02553.1 YjbF family lipoprotein [Pseudoroseicyclus tamaricis]
MMRKALIAAALMALSSCGTTGQQSPVLTLARAAIPALGAGPPGDPSAAPPGFSPQEVAANPGAYSLITIHGLYPAGLARIVEASDGRVTYESQYRFSAAYRDGILVGTRGLADDLMAADPGNLLAAIRAGGGTTRRVHETLSPLDEIERTSFDCTIGGGALETVNLGLKEVPARGWEEECLGGGLQFKNKYWLDSAGEIVASRQFVSETVAYLRENSL